MSFKKFKIEYHYPFNINQTIFIQQIVKDMIFSYIFYISFDKRVKKNIKNQIRPFIVIKIFTLLVWFLRKQREN